MKYSIPSWVVPKLVHVDNVQWQQRVQESLHLVRNRDNHRMDRERRCDYEELRRRTPVETGKERRERREWEWDRRRVRGWCRGYETDGFHTKRACLRCFFFLSYPSGVSLVRIVKLPPTRRENEWANQTRQRTTSDHRSTTHRHDDAPCLC